jgi:hypothetical protein
MNASIMSLSSSINERIDHDDVESSVPSRQVLQDSCELLVRARDQDSIVGASATVKSPDLLVARSCAYVSLSYVINLCLSCSSGSPF